MRPADRRVSESPLEELLAIVQRDLSADAVRVADPGDEPPPDDASVRCELPDGRLIIAGFAAPPADAAARGRRLAMLVSAFRDILADDPRNRSPRPPPARSLQEELSALTQRAGAVEAVVIDGYSPVIWGSAGPLEDHLARLADILPDLRAKGGLHAVDADDVAAAAEYGLASAQGLRVDPAAQSLVPRPACAHHRVLPISKRGDKLVVAMADPRDAGAVHDLVILTGLQIEPVYAGASMAALIRHLDDEDGDARTLEDVLAAVPEADREARAPLAARARDAWARSVLTRRAIAEVRELPEAEALNRGAQIRHTAASPDLGYVARSFSSIYLLILVFPGPFDELLAKRALAHAMPTVERLVAALPPLEPPPHVGGVAALRAGRRRR